MNNIDTRLILLLISSEATIQKMVGSEEIDYGSIITSVEEVLDTPLNDFYKEIIDAFSSIEEGKPDEIWFDVVTDLLMHIKNRYEEQLTLTDVSQQRELLLDFLKWQSIAYSCNNDEIGNAKEVEAFFKSKNCG